MCSVVLDDGAGGAALGKDDRALGSLHVGEHLRRPGLEFAQADYRCRHSTCLEYGPISGPIIRYSHGPVSSEATGYTTRSMRNPSSATTWSTTGSRRRTLLPVSGDAVGSTRC